MNDEPLSDESIAEIESRLKKLRPAPLSPDLLSRLTQAMEFASSEKAHNIITMEDIRRGTQPLLQSKPKSELSKKRRSGRSRQWALAASVAILGAATALFITDFTDRTSRNKLITHTGTPADSTELALIDPALTDTGLTTHSSAVAVAYDGINPEGYIPSVQSPLKEKIRWQNNDSPHKYIKANYSKLYQMKDKDGRTIEVSVPGTRYIFIPDEAY